jgi:hypothetical protein
MRRELVVAASALIAVVALVGLPDPAGSRTASRPGLPGDAVFTALTVSATPPPAPEPQPPSAALDKAARSAGFLDETTPLVEAATGPTAPKARAATRLPAPTAGRKWKTPRQTLTGYATFYDNGTTAMRLPRGTTVVICGKGGCIERVVNDYGPIKKIRVVDMYRKDFFGICGCGWWSGTAWVTVWVY